MFFISLGLDSLNNRILSNIELVISEALKYM